MPQAQPCLSSCMFQRKEAAYRSILPARCSGFQCHKPSPFTYIRTRTVRRFSENNEQEEAKKKKSVEALVELQPSVPTPTGGCGQRAMIRGRKGPPPSIAVCMTQIFSLQSSLPASLPSGISLYMHVSFTSGSICHTRTVTSPLTCLLNTTYQRKITPSIG